MRWGMVGTGKVVEVVLMLHGGLLRIRHRHGARHLCRQSMTLVHQLSAMGICSRRRLPLLDLLETANLLAIPVVFCGIVAHRKT